MGIHHREHKSPLPHPINTFKPRDLRWLWSFLTAFQWLNQGHKLQLTYDDLSFSASALEMANAIKQHENPVEFVDWILSQYHYAVIPEEHLKWIEAEDHRLLIWILFNLKEPIAGQTITQPLLSASSPEVPPPPLVMPHPATIHSKTRYEKIITAIDCWPYSCQGKINYLLEKKNEWIHCKTPEKQTRWINPTAFDQLTWAWEYLEKKGKALNIPKPADAMEYHAAVLASLDEMSYGHPSDKTLFLEQMKRTWSQKKFRDSGKAKKPYYLPLTIKTREKLIKLSENSGKKPTDVLQQLIDDAYEKWI